MFAGKNKVINGDFSIWQRGISVATGTAFTYGADRWQSYRNSLVTGMTVSRQTTSDTTNLPFIQYCARVQRDSGNSATNALVIHQSFESVNSIPLAGRTVTFSFYARAGANYSSSSSIVSVQLVSGTGTNQNYGNGGFTNSTSAINDTRTLTTTWQRFSYPATLASNITQLAAIFFFTPTGTAGANDYFEITGVQVEAGDTATPFVPAGGGSVGAELALCQRYYYLLASGNNKVIGIGTYFSSTAVYAIIDLPVTMRTAPAVSVVSGTDYYAIDRNGTADGFNNFSVWLAQDNICGLLNSSQTSGTAGQSGMVRTNNNAAFVALQAEL
jgi:hypothetical protein